MSISSELTALQQDITNARTAVTSKGGTVTTGGGSNQLATDISTIPTQKTEQSKTLTLGASTPQTVAPDSGKVLSSVPVTLDTSVIKAENIAKDVQMLGITGTHEGGGSSTKYGVGIDNMLGDIDASGTYQEPSATFSFTGTGIKTMTVDRGFFYKFYSSGITSFSMPDLIDPNGSNAFNYVCASCSNCTNVDLRNVTTATVDNVFASAFNKLNTSTPVTFNFNSLQSSTGNNAFQQAFGYNKNVYISFPSLITIRGSQAFYGAFTYNQGNTVVDFPVLETVSDFGCFYNFVNVKTYASGWRTCIKMPKLKNVGTLSASNSVFYNFTQNTKDIYYIWFESLENCGSTSYNCTTMFYRAFYGSGNYTLEAYFPSLINLHCSGTTSTTSSFYQCTRMKKIYLPKCIFGRNPTYTFSSCTYLSEIHFGIENQSTIEALSGYSSKFGATNATIYFDLVNHITVDGVVYDRDGADYDIQYTNNEYDASISHFAWKDTSGNIIYTTEAWVPTVGDTTYTKSGSTYTAGLTIGAVA